MFFDGAFGTYYITKTDDYQPCEGANITNPQTVISIHKEYIAAGADAIKTNTFAANSKTFPNEQELREVIVRGYELAEQAARGTDVKIFASIGNIRDEQDLSEKYLQVANIFISLGAKNFLFETLSGFDEIVPALEVIKSNVDGAVVMVSFAVSRDGFTQSGLNYKAVIDKAAKNPNVDIVGMNCICGPTHILELVKNLGLVAKPLAAMPNSGYPATVNGRTVFSNNAEYFAKKILEINRAGVSVLGGCCGTTPEHIALAVNAVKTDAAAELSVRKPEVTREKSSLESKLKRKPIAVELDPPVDSNIDFIMDAVDKLKACGVDIITLADSPMAKTRADSFLTAALIKRERNIDVLPHLTCRDKNFIAIKGALVGASFYGINKVLVITGDPVVNSENYRNPSVFNFNSKELISFIRDLNTEVFADDKAFSIGGALNVNSQNFDAELERCAEKVANGAEFLYSQPMFSHESIDNFKRAKKRLECKLFAGILPIVSYKNAMFLNNELTGISVPQHIIERLLGKTPDEVQDISVQFCAETIRQVYDHADGFYIMTPMKKVDLVCDLLQRCFDD